MVVHLTPAAAVSCAVLLCVQAAVAGEVWQKGAARGADFTLMVV